MGRWQKKSAWPSTACRADEPDARLQRLGKTELATSRVPGDIMRRWSQILIWMMVGVALAGCPKKGTQDYKEGEKAFEVNDYDAAVDYCGKALATDPHNAYYRIKLNDARFEAGQMHVHQGIKLREKGDLQGAISQFQRAQILDPSSIVADQELKKTLDMLAEQVRASEQQNEQPLMDNGQPALASQPPELKPLSRAPVNLKMSNDAKAVFDTIGKLAGLTVIYDPDLQARRITIDLNNVTLEQALDIVSLESKAFWKPVTENIIMVIPDQTQKRRDYDEQVVRTFYLSNVAIPQDLTEITTGLRQLLDLKRVQQVNAQNAIIVRDTPDKLALIDKIIKDIDKAKPEVIIQVEVLEARTDHMRNLGILPPKRHAYLALCVSGAGIHARAVVAPDADKRREISRMLKSKSAELQESFRGTKIQQYQNWDGREMPRASRADAGLFEGLADALAKKSGGIDVGFGWPVRDALTIDRAEVLDAFRELEPLYRVIRSVAS